MTNQELKEALHEYVSLWSQVHPEQPELPFALSPSYLDKMELLFKHQPGKKQKKIKLVKRTLLIAAIILILGTTTAFAVEPVREFFYGLIQTIFATHTEVSADLTNKQEEKESTFQTKSLSWVPERFKLIEDEFYENTLEYTSTYEEIAGDGYFLYVQSMLNGTTLNINNENFTYSELLIEEVTVFFQENAGYSSAYWSDSCCFYEISGTITIEEIEKICKSLL